MIEDKSFNEFIKAKLEEDVGELPSLVVAENISSRCFVRPLMWAASIVAICGLLSVHFLNDRGYSDEQLAMGVIEILDVDSITASNESFSERLLAWQDAPYTEIVN